MEETVIEIPSSDSEEGWQPPVLTHKIPEKPPKLQSCTDVFFMQYVICILLVTAVFVIRYYDSGLCETTMQNFLAWTHAPTERVLTELIAYLQNQWS